MRDLKNGGGEGEIVAGCPGLVVCGGDGAQISGIKRAEEKKKGK